MKMAKKRFLNVFYENQLVEIDTNDMERFSQVQEKLLLAFKEISVGYARIQLWNMTATPEIQIDDFDDIKALPEDYYWESKKPGALFLTVQLIPSPASNEDTISLSVQGTVLVLKRKDILSFDWMVSRLITSSVPSFKHNDMIYIDVDATSFRMILSILQGLTDLPLEVSRISSAEMTLLKSTAAYLLCVNIVKEIEAFETEYQKLLADRDILASQLAESKKSDDFHIIEAIKKLPISLMKCNGYRTRRTRNICASNTLVIGGNVKYTDDDSIEKCTQCKVHLDDFSRLCCTECENDFSRLWGNQKKFSISSIEGMEDLAHIIKNLND
jgi:hypothetical protein